MIPMNETAKLGANASHRAFVLRTEPVPVSALRASIAFASACWDEAAACLAKGDFAGFDAAMRLFRKVSQGGRVAQEAPASNQ